MTYTMLYRPASSWTLPNGVSWEYVNAPWDLPNLISRGIPASSHRYGVIRCARALTQEEIETFEMRPVDPS